MTQYGRGPELEVPVLDDPHVLAAHLDFIKRLGIAMTGIQISTMWILGRWAGGVSGT